MSFLRKVKGYTRLGSFRNVGIRGEQEVNNIVDDIWNEWQAQKVDANGMHAAISVKQTTFTATRLELQQFDSRIQNYSCWGLDKKYKALFVVEC